MKSGGPASAGRGLGGEIYRQSIRWSDSDLPDQREFTRAMARWLDNEHNGHANSLANTLVGFDALMAALYSVYVGRRVNLPVAVPNDLVPKLEERYK